MTMTNLIRQITAVEKDLAKTTRSLKQCVLIQQLVPGAFDSGSCKSQWKRDIVNQDCYYFLVIANGKEHRFDAGTVPIELHPHRKGVAHWARDNAIRSGHL